MHRLQELVRLHRLGIGPKQVARLLKMSPTTERSYRVALVAAGLLEGGVDDLPRPEALREAVQTLRPEGGRPKHETSSLEKWRPQIETLFGKGLGPKAIYDRLRLQESEFDGSYASMKRMCRALRHANPVRAQDVAIRVDTLPGDVAQIDFGYVGRLMCPETHVPRRAWVFVMVLGYSRHMFARVVFDQKSATWLHLHREAFEYFGGAPQTLVPDNLKSAVVRAAFSVDDEIALHRSYRELARHYGCKIDPTPPYAPQKKGKVESAVKYVKHNVLAARDGESIDDVNRALAQWLEMIAGQRVHGTTRRRPLEVFESKEQPVLHPLPTRPFEMVVWKDAKVHTDAHVSFDGRLYSVPWRWMGKRVWVCATSTSVAIFANDSRIATHSRNGKGRCSTDETHLPEHRRDLRHRSRGFWEERAARIGPDTAGLVREIFDSDDVLSELRTVQAIVTHLETFPVQRAEAAARRASFYGTFTYRGVKNILTKALDMEPLPRVALPASEGERPRFARSIDELLGARLEVVGESH